MVRNEHQNNQAIINATQGYIKQKIITKIKKLNKKNWNFSLLLPTQQTVKEYNIKI